MPLDALHTFYDALVQYASHHPQGADLQQGRQEYITRTGDLFESDTGFERRICAFLEWFTLDCLRGLAPHKKTLLQQYAEHQALTAQDHEAAQAWQMATPSLFAVAKISAHACVLDDLLLSLRHVVAPTSVVVGLAPKDIIAGRVVTLGGTSELTCGVSYFPKAAAKVLHKVSKKYRKGQVPGVSRLDLLHRFIFLTNRCERYRHVNPERIFTAGEAQLVAAESPGQP